MRHSLRLDLECISNEEKAKLWPEINARPYDSPIVESDLPIQQAQELIRSLKDESFDVVYCSPFRRCLQTAGHVLRTLHKAGKVKNAEVTAVRGLGEVMWKITPLTLEYLSLEQMATEAGESVTVLGIIGETPNANEDASGSANRFFSTILQIQKENPGKNILFIAHGDTVAAAGSIAKQVVYEVLECGFVMVKDKKLVGESRVSYFEDD